MNRAGTPSGKVAAARLKTDKKFNMEGYKPIDKKKENEMYRRAGNLARTSLSSTGAKKKESASKSAKIVSAISRQKENERFDKMADIKARDNYTEEVVQSILEKCWAGYEKKGMKTMFGKRYPNCVKKKATRKEEVEVDEKYQGMYQSPAPTYNRLKSNDEKARMSPGRRAMAKSDELEKSEPGSKRAKAQKKASMQMSRNFKSARATKEEVEVKESDSAFEFVKNELIKKHGAASIVGTPENKAATAKRKEEAKKNKKKPAPDTRTDAQKMTDATGPRPGSRYRGD